ncbi:MAG: hypothetical protein ABIU20_06820, partial [Blastocatellia bacterium]
TSGATHQTAWTPLSQPAHAAEILRLNIPVVTHGFEKTSQLPNGDLFLLPDPMQMAITDAPEGTKVFPIGFESFGGDSQSIGALAGVTPQGLASSAPNSKVVAKTCSESIWDGNFVLAATPGTTGDTVRFFLEKSDGSKGPELARFTVKTNGVEVTQLHSELMLFVNNRFANGPSTHQSDFIAYAASAGESGLRTDLLTFAWPMQGFSELQGCFRVGIEITRGDNFGTTSVVVTDFVVNRNHVTGDENNTGTGLLRSLRGGFPTGFPCKAECPFTPDPPLPPLPPVPNNGQGNGDQCNAICYRSPQYFKLNPDRWPHGTVLIAGMNGNHPVSTSNKRMMGLALAGGYTPTQKFNQEFVAAQLNALLAGGDGSPKLFYAMEGKLSCYNLKFDEITLSSGVTLSPDSQLKELYQQARQSIANNSIADQIELTKIFDQINGNNPLGACNNLWK